VWQLAAIHLSVELLKLLTARQTGRLVTELRSERKAAVKFCKVPASETARERALGVNKE